LISFSIFPPKSCISFSFNHTRYVPSQFQSSRFYHPKKVLRGQYRSLSVQYRSLSEQYRSLSEQYRSLSEQYTSLSEQYRSLRSPLRILLYSCLTSPLLGQNITLNTLFLPFWSRKFLYFSTPCI
jgi:hypothetical protein